MDVLEPMEKWSRVRTGDGYIGYIENRKLEAGEQVMPESLFEALYIPAFPWMKGPVGIPSGDTPGG